MSAPLTLHPDRAFPADPTTREITRTIYSHTAGLPLICMHGHVEAQRFAENPPFEDPAELLIIPDHYVHRMLASQGIKQEDLGVWRVDGGPVETDSRKIFRTFCANWKLFRGTPSRYWLEHEFVEVFGIDEVPSEESADRIYDKIAAKVADPSFRPQQLLDTFNIEIISTTDPASSDLSYHKQLAEQGLGERVVPTFRPDGVFQPARSTWRDEIKTLAEVSGIDTSTYAGFLDALRERRQAFVAAGGRATDHGHFLADTTPLSDHEASELYAKLLAGAEPTVAENDAFAANMLFVSAGMSCEDGLTMQIHPGSFRDHNTGIFQKFGQDKGFDIPVATEYTRALRPLLDAYGMDPRFRLNLFTLDETVFSRELAPIAGVYPSVKLGAPWWFLDSPDGMRRYREAVTETAGFYNFSGFVDDTRAYASIPARHDLSRRIDAGYLARLVAEHRIGEDEAVETAIDLAYNLPKASYPKLKK